MKASTEGDLKWFDFLQSKVPASLSLSPPALVLLVLSDPARSHNDRVLTAIWSLS